MARLLCAESEGRDKWLAARMEVISASDAASVLGFGFTSRPKLLAEKISRVAEDTGVGKLAQVRAGVHHEPAVASWFGEFMGMPYTKGQGLLAHDTVKHMGATMDFVLPGGIPLECKNIGFEVRTSWHANGTPTKGWPDHLPLPVPSEIKTAYPTINLQVAKLDIGTARGEFRQALQDLYKQYLPALGAPCAPLKYVCQLYAQMFVAEVDHGWIAAAIGGTTHFALRYERDADFEVYMLQECESFWAEVEAGRAEMSAVGF